MKITVRVTAICIFLIQQTVFANDSFQKIDCFLNIAFQHARNYPPKFDSPVQRRNLEMQLNKTIVQLEAMIKNSASDSKILFRLGKASTFAYNLDIDGSKEKADKYFNQLFILKPKHAEGHLYYGYHLSGRGKFNKAIKHLKIAADAGRDIALTMIGMTYMHMKNNDKAKVYFEKFQKKYPDDRQTKILLNALKSSKYKYKLMRVRNKK